MSMSAMAASRAVASALTGCASPFGDHADDVKDAWSAKARDAHRKYDRYILGLDWDDPNHDWHDDSYASQPMHH